MARNRLERSNSAHDRLRKKNAVGNAKHIFDNVVKYTYHGNVRLEQKRLGRLLTSSEKKEEYANAVDCARLMVR